MTGTLPRGWDTQIEKTRCGGCERLRERCCPNGNVPKMLVPSWYADQCSKYKEAKK